MMHSLDHLGIQKINMMNNAAFCPRVKRVDGLVEVLFSLKVQCLSVGTRILDVTNLSLCYSAFRLVMQRHPQRNRRFWFGFEV